MPLIASPREVTAPERAIGHRYSDHFDKDTSFKSCHAGTWTFDVGFGDTFSSDARMRRPKLW